MTRLPTDSWLRRALDSDAALARLEATASHGATSSWKAFVAGDPGTAKLLRLLFAESRGCTVAKGS